MRGDPLPANQRCPRCDGAMRCGVDDPGPCACTQVVLDDATRARLRARYSGCLCTECLRVIAAAAATTRSAAER